MSVCPLTRARRFSIASSPKKRRGCLAVVVESRAGLCADYLKRVGDGRVTLKIEDSKIEYPKDRSTPIIVIAVGVGIAVAFGLLEFRKYNDGPFGTFLMVGEFGRREQTPVIQSIVKEYVDARLVDTVLWAFSEEDDAACHSWQEALEKNVKIMWPVWVDDRCQVFLAGRVHNGAKELVDILKRITMIEGGLRNEEAAAWTEKHLIVVEDMSDAPKKT
jgi:sulfite reductase alpha subunit-like flavoprotein